MRGRSSLHCPQPAGSVRAIRRPHLPRQETRRCQKPSWHSFTVADQVDLLVSAREADADLGFMARTMALCSLPRSNPGNRLQYKRVNGPFTLYMTAGGGNKLPFGNLPRLLLAWVCTEAVRTRSRELVLGRSLSEFMRTLDIYSNSGRVHTRLRNQMKRLFGCTVTMVYEGTGGLCAGQFVCSGQTRVLVERAQARRAFPLGKQDRVGREVLQRDHPTPGAD